MLMYGCLTFCCRTLDLHTEAGGSSGRRKSEAEGGGHIQREKLLNELL